MGSMIVTPNVLFNTVGGSRIPHAVTLQSSKTRLVHL